MDRPLGATAGHITAPGLPRDEIQGGDLKTWAAAWSRGTPLLHRAFVYESPLPKSQLTPMRNSPPL